jgi:cell division protein ZapE
VSSRSRQLLARYEALTASGLIERDDAQLAILLKLEQLAKTINESDRTRGRRAKLALALARFKRKPAESPRGLYIWGAVGRGKTTLMDLFFDSVEIDRKRRTHFHAFMADVHERLHQARRTANDDPVRQVASQIAKETHVLCFDEFSVGDIADATILARLFTALLADGVVVVATSNVAPARLYEGGRNRELFPPFVALLQERLDVAQLEARRDFRLEKRGSEQVYHSPANDEAKRAIDAFFLELTGRALGDPMTIEVKRREIKVPQAAGKVARFDFQDLCGSALGAADYEALTRNFDTIIVERVPAMGEERRNEARRFITLVDVLYDAKTKLVLSAETDATSLYRARHGHEAREFKRTASRLIEMRSEDYLQAPRMGVEESVR